MTNITFPVADNFKPLNDAIGHDVGDMLQLISDRPTSSVRESDTVAPVGGDEFAVILEG